LVYADRKSDDLAKASEILDRLSPDLAKTYKKYIASMKKKWVRRAKAAERREKAAEEAVDLVHQHYIDMEYQDVDGNRVSLSSVVDNPANRYVILDFWATWCGPCVQSIPMLKEVYERYHDKGLEIYSVSHDSKAKEWKSFVAENGMTWVNVLGKDRKAGRDYGVEYIPAVFLIDCKTGEILVSDGHPDLESILSELLP
jgi:thiol-disulfide isomerase/thioredoxin